MLKRLLLVIALCALPLTAFADTSASDPAASATLSQPQASTADLGPSTSGGSTGDGTSLQPAGTNPLQSQTSDSNGLTAPDSSYLQEPATSSNSHLQVMLGDSTDGGPQQLPGTGPNYWAWLFICLIILIVGGAAAWIIRTRRTPLLSVAQPDLLAQDELPDVGDSDRSPESPDTPITESLFESDTPAPSTAPEAEAATEVHKLDPTPRHTSKAKKTKKQKHRSRH